jgi:hypothetical protein
MKYQFCIRFNNIDANSAASKAVLDCNRILLKHGYLDYTLTVGDNSNKFSYYFLLLKELIKFFIGIKSHSIVAVQYPLLSINNVFKYFINIAKLKGVRFFCIIHDLESLRKGGDNEAEISNEIDNLSYYDTVIIHNEIMGNWLKDRGLKCHMVPLILFDYLADDFEITSNEPQKAIVFAGNLCKSTFVYQFKQIAGCSFRLYGPGYKPNGTEAENTTWVGEYSPDHIPQKLTGSFGLIWDGQHIDKCDAILGNYLAYNNPHKCSLYIAAGLPIIAPATSAIGVLVKKMNIGLLVNNLHDLKTLDIDTGRYAAMKNNIVSIRKRVINGSYFSDAINLLEKRYATNRN